MTGAVCVTRNSDMMCDGVEHCVDDADEDPQLCFRRGRMLDLDTHDDDDDDGVSDGLMTTVLVLSCVVILLLSSVVFILYRLRLRRSVSRDFIHLEYQNKNRDQRREEDIYVIPENTKSYCKQQTESFKIVPNQPNQYINVNINDYVPMTSFSSK